MHVMYDRSALRAAAAEAGIENSNQLAKRLRLNRMTAHRLWHGLAEPTRGTAAAVTARLNVAEADLLVLADDASAEGGAA
jgi:hypothetical protein